MWPVWADDVDDILAGDLVVALAYGTPAGGTVLTPVCPLGLRDRDTGRVGFTTSVGFGRKLERIAADPKVALAFHTRAHGLSRQPGYVLVQGTATAAEPTRETTATVTRQAELHLGPIARGWFWDRWLRVYYQDRVALWVRAERVTYRDAEGRVVGVSGTPAPARPPAAQGIPKGGAGPRVDARAAGRRVARHPHRLLGYRDTDGYPVVVPVDVTGADESGIALRPAWPVPDGGRRAGLLGHRFRPRVAGLSLAQHTGWLTADGDLVRYAPHTARRFALPPSKTLTLLLNGLASRIGARQARRAGRTAPTG